MHLVTFLNNCINNYNFSVYTHIYNIYIYYIFTYKYFKQNV